MNFSICNSKKIKHKLVPGSMALWSVATFNLAYAAEPIQPPMVNIPAGEFIMGSDLGIAEIGPAHKLSIDAFQLAKYPVTMTEFRRFIEDTGYQVPSTCKDKLDRNWLSGPSDVGTANWDTHRYVKSEYQPATCVNWPDVNAYIEWLNNKTGLQYRLPTEQEWEYAEKAHTTSRYFWGDDLDGSQACYYGNFADQSGEYYANKLVGASYVGFIDHLSCDDGEAFVSMVGLYRPNPFGLYDMSGNTKNWVGSCRDNPYPLSQPPKVSFEECEFITLKGLSWHRMPKPHEQRDYSRKQGHSASTLNGFRLAMDGHNQSSHSSTQQFESDYAKAKADYLKQRELIPTSPENVQLHKIDEQTVKLSWQKSSDPRVTGYEVYYSDRASSHMIGRYYGEFYNKINTTDKSTNQLNIKQSNVEGSYRVVAITNTLESLPSEAVTLELPKRLEIPGKLSMKDVSDLKNISLFYSSRENDPEPYYIGKVNPSFWQPLITASLKVKVKESGWYRLNYRGGSRVRDGEFFSLYSGNTLLKTVDFKSDIDDKVSDRIKVYLEKGDHDLQLTVKKKGFDRWSLSWLAFTAI